MSGLVILTEQSFTLVKSQYSSVRIKIYTRVDLRMRAYKRVKGVGLDVLE